MRLSFTQVVTALTDPSEFLPLDPTQDPIFPPELQVYMTSFSLKKSGCLWLNFWADYNKPNSQLKNAGFKSNIESI